MIYLDYNATTPVAPEAVEVMLAYVREEFGNPSSDYLLGSRAREALDFVEGRIRRFRQSPSDLDIGVKPRKPLSIEEKVHIAILLEDLFDVNRVDLVVIPEAPVSLAAEIVSGELLYAEDGTYEAEYQLAVLRQAADVLPFEQMKQRMILGR